LKISIAETRIAQGNLLIAIVETESVGPAGDLILKKLNAFYPHLPAMLISVSDNGFSAYAHFETHRLLAMIQLKALVFHRLI
jgi:hypothetical protein